MKTHLPLLVCALLVLAACAPQPTAAPTSLPSATPLPPPTPTADPNACLRGDWALSTEDAANLLAYITSNPSLTIIEGSLRMQFEDGTFAYHSKDLIPQITFLDGFIQATANIFIEGTTKVEADKLLFTQTGIDNKLTDWKALDAQGNPLPLVFANTPVMAFTIAPQATYSCSGDELALVFDVEDLAGQTFNLERIK